MLTTIEGQYKGGKVELTEEPAGIEQAPVLVTFLPSSAKAAKPQPLYGAWKDKLPADFDIDSALSDIRGECAAELRADSA
jgi:hypothetical protein